MLKRSLAVLLWFYTGWYAGALIAYHLGLSEVLGPILGTAAAALFAGDPRRIIWVRPAETAPATGTRTSAPDPA
jgi:hypothetical protein